MAVNTPYTQQLPFFQNQKSVPHNPRPCRSLSGESHHPASNLIIRYILFPSKKIKDLKKKQHFSNGYIRKDKRDEATSSNMQEGEQEGGL
jgi:hypothetical protein